MTISLEYRLLGPLEVRVDGRIVPVNSARQRMLLAALLVDANRTVSYDQLISRVWDDDVPPGARNTLHSYVMRLRRAIGADAAIRTRPDGYLIEVPPGNLDTSRFESLVHAARAAGDPATAATLLRQALELWRGEPLSDVSSAYLLREFAATWRERRLAAVELRVDADLSLGRHQDVTAELADLTARHPVRERFWAQRMLALHRSGRTAEALHCYGVVRQRLAEELGVDPAAELRDLHQAILTEDPTLATPVPAAITRPHRNDLPGDIPDFIGRADEFDQLLGMLPGLSPDADDQAHAVVISAIDGMAGIGKTTLAIHAAHRLTERYPDAQIFLDLRAHSEQQDPIDPATALGILLRAIGVPADRVPAEQDERAALWRAELAHRKVLLVLDNAASGAQVRPLLPGSPTCLALITSRRRLADLDTTATLSLDVLPESEAFALFTSVVGAERTDADRAATSDILRLCGYLPLAIRIAAARLRSRPIWPVRELADRLRVESRRNDELVIGDRSVTAAFTLSYERVAPARQRLFRLLSRYPGGSFDSHLAAAATGVSVAEARDGLEELVDIHLLAQPRSDRYRFHDLLRRFAYQECEKTESETDRRAATRRVLDYYLHTARRATHLLDTTKPLIAMADDDIPVRDFATYDEAMAWYDTERPNLLTVIAGAAHHGSYQHVWQLTSAIWYYCFLRGGVTEWVGMCQLALDATERLGDRHARAEMLKISGTAHMLLGQADIGFDEFNRALAGYRESGDQQGEANVHNNLGLLNGRNGRYAEAISELRQAVRLQRIVGNRMAESACMCSIGFIYRRTGQYEQALASHREALELSRANGYTSGEAEVLSGIGDIYNKLGRHAEALEQHEKALAIIRRTGGRYNEIDILNGLGETHRMLGQPDQALYYHQQALTLTMETLDPAQEANARVGIARVLRERDPAAARLYWQRALALYTELDAPEAPAVAAEFGGVPHP